MTGSLDFLAEHGYLVVFLWVFAEQIGLPLPSSIVLLGAGAAAANNLLSLEGVIAASFAATGISDVIWYEIGRRKGTNVLGFLCRISLEPDSCVRRTEERFARHGVRSLLIAKFVPGLNTAAPPLAGMFGMGFWKFLAFDLLGGLIWIGSFSLVGFAFAGQLEILIGWSRHFGLGGGILIVLAVLVWAGWKYVQRRRFIRGLQVSAISPEELKHLLDQGNSPMIVDLRHEVELAANPIRLPGALQIAPSELTSGKHNLAVDREIVLYCT